MLIIRVQVNFLDKSIETNQTECSLPGYEKCQCKTRNGQPGLMLTLSAIGPERSEHTLSNLL